MPWHNVMPRDPDAPSVRTPHAHVPNESVGMVHHEGWRGSEGTTQVPAPMVREPGLLFLLDIVKSVRETPGASLIRAERRTET